MVHAPHDEVFWYSGRRLYAVNEEAARLAPELDRVPEGVLFELRNGDDHFDIEIRGAYVEAKLDLLGTHLYLYLIRPLRAVWAWLKRGVSK